MDENMSDDENREESPKRLKTDDNISIEKSEESSSSSPNTEQENASTSTDSGFPRSRNSRNRNYRNRKNSEEAYDIRDEDRSPENAVETVNDSAVPEDMATEEEEEEVDGSPRDRLANFLNDLGGSDSTVIQDTDTESEDGDHPVLKKTKPKHTWFVVPEVVNRQFGARPKFKSPELFQRRCYGSLHSVQRLELMYKLEEHEGCVNSLNFHPNGSLLASGSDDLKVVVWDWKIGKCLLKYDTKHRTNVFQSKFLNLSGDLHIVTCARDGQVRIAQVSAQEGVRDNRKLGSHRGPCHKIAVLAEQPHVVLSAGEDGLVLSHDVRLNKPEKLVCVRDLEREVALYSIHGHPLAPEFCVSGRDHIVRVYDQRKSIIPLATFYPSKNTQNSDLLHVTCAVYNHDGSQILASYSDADIYLFNTNSEPGTYAAQFQGHRNANTIKGVNFFGPKSEFIVSGSDCGNVYFWEKESEAIVQWMLADDNGVVNCLEPHPQLPFICTSGLDWDVKVWVPSCEQAPDMAGLPQTLHNNRKLRNTFSSRSDINESQMLWMLWRHLRSTSRIRRGGLIGDNDDGDNILVQINTHSSSSSSSSSDSFFDGEEEEDDDDDDADLDGPTGCSTS